MSRHHSNIHTKSLPVGKIAKEEECVFVNMLSKIHSYRLLFRRFCPLGFNSLYLQGCESRLKYKKINNRICFLKNHVYISVFTKFNVAL